MDKNNDGLLIASDVVQYCLQVFSDKKGKYKIINQNLIEEIVTEIFSYFGNGPFDPIDFSVL